MLNPRQSGSCSQFLAWLKVYHIATLIPAGHPLPRSLSKLRAELLTNYRRVTMELTEALLLISGIANAVLIVWLLVWDQALDRAQYRIDQLELEKRSGLVIGDRHE